MTIAVWLLTAVLVAAIVALFGFAGCTTFGPGPEPTVPPPSGRPYAEIVKLTDGFMAHWPLDEGGPGPARVVSALPLDGTYVGGVTPGANGAFHHKDLANRAPTFGGASGYVEVPYHANLTPAANVPFSLELWVKPDPAQGGATQVLVSFHQIEGARLRGYEIALVRAGQPHPQVRATVFSDGVSTTLTRQPTAGDPDAWRHIVLAYNASGGGQSLTLFVNVAGQPNTAASETPDLDPDYKPLTTKAVTLRFGAGHQAMPAAGPDRFFAGRLDEIAFYNRALTVADVVAHFQAF